MLWIDPYPTRLPRWSDLARIRVALETAPSSVTPPWLTVIKSGGLPIEPLPGSGWVNRFFWRQALRRIDDFVEGGSAWLVVGKPSVLAHLLLRRLHHCASLYDAMDDFPAFYTGLSRNALARREQRIAQRVDAIWASSSWLDAQWRRYRSEVCLVPNGLDLSATSAVKRSSEPSARKIFGYVGTTPEHCCFSTLIVY